MSMRNRLFGLLAPPRGTSRGDNRPNRPFPRRYDAARRLLDPEVTVEHAFESFDSEDSQLLTIGQEIAPIVPAPIPPPPPPPTPAVAPVSTSLSLAPSLASSVSATGLDPRTIPTALLAPDWPKPQATVAFVPKVEDTASVSSPVSVDLGAPDVKVSAAIALLVGWVIALTMAGVAFLSEAPRLLPAMKSAIVRPASPPPPVIQTHRTEDIDLPSPPASRARKSR